MWQSKDLSFRLTDCVPRMPRPGRCPGIFVSESLGLKVRYWPLVDIQNCRSMPAFGVSGHPAMARKGRFA
jgi:hypothetical protein